MDYYHSSQQLLANFQIYRIIQPRLVFLHGLPKNLAKKQELHIQMKRIGTLCKLSFQSLSKDFYSAFIQFSHQSQAALAIIALDGTTITNRVLRVFYGSTKLCPHFLKGHQCRVKDCNYAHYYHPYLVYRKDQAKNIDHLGIAHLIATQYPQESAQTFSKCLYFPQQKWQLVLKTQKIQQLLPNGQTIDPQTQCLEYENETTQTEVSVEDNQVATENNQITIEDSQVYIEDNQVSIDEKGTSQQQIPEKRDVNVEQTGDWSALGSNISSYLTSQDREITGNRQTKVQQFLDGAERFLSQLIFESSPIVY